MKVLLSFQSDSNDKRESVTTIMPLGLFSLASSLERKGHSVVLANLSHMGIKKAVQTIGSESPDAVAFSMVTHNRNDTLKLIKECRLKYPRMIIVAGGPFASAMSGELARRYPEIDYIIEGSGNISLDAVLSKAKGVRSSTLIVAGKPDSKGRIFNGIDSSSQKIGINPNEQFKMIAASRSSGGGDPFSYAANFWGDDDYIRTPSEVADEMEKAYREYGILFFNLTDEAFCSDESAMKEFHKELSSRDFYPMWSAVVKPKAVTENLALIMKQAGCERISILAGSGSQKILDSINPGTTVEDICRAFAAVRSVGEYTSLILRAGLYDETHADILKTISLIRKCLPGEGTVIPAVYHPGSRVYSQAVAAQRIDPSVFFEHKDKGIYLRSDPDMRGWIEQIRTELKIIRQKSWYADKDFRVHKKTLLNCWVTDILEGDYYLDAEKDNKAGQCYLNVAARLPRNPWGHLRIGKLSFGSAQFDSAENHFRKVTEIVPQYYGGWLKLAESIIAQGRKKEGRETALRAYALNKWDVRITRILENI